ncbi:MAG: hypothetical protein NTY34_02810 [Candidatus Omnitrophica bacterium]|nr:hypothetical protein [Candidatus Omnitrophota bacterium]
MSEIEKQANFQAALICETIEKRASYGRDIKLEDIKDWARLKATDKGFESARYIEYGDEMHIVVNDRVLIRYFRRDAGLLSFLFSGASLIFPTSKLTPSLSRQIYRINRPEAIPALPAPRDIMDIFAHIIKKSGLEKFVTLCVDAYKVARKQYPTCKLTEDGLLTVHPEFILDYQDIQNSGIGFNETFEDGVTRWIDLADSIAYRVAMHEFKLKGREGLNHGFFTEDGRFGYSDDEWMANFVGRRYSLVDDAMWLWYLHSYKLSSEKIKYDNNILEYRLKYWVFDSNITNPYAVQARNEFPALLNDPKRLEKAIRLALMINEEFFIKRKRAGIDTTPAYQRKPTASPQGDATEKGSDVFAGGDAGYRDEGPGAREIAYTPIV